MSGFLAAELYKLVRRPMTWIVLGILLAILTTLRALLIAISFVPIPEGQGTVEGTQLLVDLVVFPGAISDALNFLPSLGIFGLLVVAASVAGTEFAWGTIVPLLARGGSRSSFIVAKVLCLLGLTVVYLLITTSVGILLGALASQLHLGFIPLEWVRQHGVQLFYGLLRSYWATVPYVVAAVALALVFRSSAFAMGIVLAYVLVEHVGLSILQVLRPPLESTGFSWLFTVLDWTLLGRNASALQTLNSRAFPPPSIAEQATLTDLHPWRAAIVLGVYSLFFLAVAIAASRRDIGTRPVST